MADDTKKVEIAITSTYDGKGAQQAAVDQDKLTNTGNGLATQLPELNEATKAYTVSTEAEYVAIQKAHNALAARIPVLQAAGKETAEYERTLANLSEALSTVEALDIAEAIEAKAMANAKEEAAAAARANAVAQEEEAAATTMNSRAMGESLTLSRELAAGRFTRIPGSLSILLQQFTDLTPALTGGLIGISSAAFLIYDYFKEINAELEKLRRQSAEIDVKVFEDQSHALSDAAKNAERYRQEIEQISEKENERRLQADQENAVLADQRSEISAIIQAEEQRDMERAKGDPAQEEAIRRKYEALRQEAEIQAELLKVESDRQALAQAQADLATAKGATGAAAVALAGAVVPEGVSEAQASKGSLQSAADTAGDAFLKAVGIAPTGNRSADMSAAMAELARRRTAAASFGPGELSYVNGPNGPTITEAGFARREAGSAQDALDAYNNAKQAITANQKIIDDWTAHLQALNDAAATAKQNFQQATKNAGAAESRLNDDQRSLQMRQETQAIISAVMQGITPQLISGAAGAERDYISSGGQPLNAKQQQLIEALKQALDLAHDNTSQILQVVWQMVEAHKSDQQIIKQISQMASQAYQGANAAY